MSVLGVGALRLEDAQGADGRAVLAVAVDVGLLLEEHLVILEAAGSVHDGRSSELAAQSCGRCGSAVKRVKLDWMIFVHKAASEAASSLGNSLQLGRRRAGR